MERERRDRIMNAAATAQTMLDRIVGELQAEEEEQDGRVSSLHGVGDVGGDPGGGEDPARRSGDEPVGRGSVSDRDVDDAADAPASRAGVAGGSSGGSPNGLPAAARHLVEGAHYKVTDGTNDGKDGILAPGSIEVSGFGRVSAEIVTPGGTVRCRAEDLVAVVDG